MVKSRIALVLFLLILMSAPAAFATPAPASTLPKITVQYFYCNACGACNETAQFQKQFDDAVGNVTDGIQVELLAYNTFQTLDDINYQDTCKKYNIPKEKQVLPMLVVNGVCLFGNEEILGRLREVFLTEKANILAVSGGGSATMSTLLYFYVSPCDECAATKEFMNTLPASYTVTSEGKMFKSLLNIASYNVADTKNLEIIKELFKKYKVPEAEQKAPIIFLKDSYLSGKEAIEQYLAANIKSGGAIGTAIPGITNGITAALTAYEWPGIFLTGLVNGFNPCSISMLLFLIALLLARKVSVLKMGFAFIIGKFIAYLALGTVLFSVLLAIDNSVFKVVQNTMKYVLLAIVVIVIAVNLSDYIGAKNEKYNKIRLQLPVGLRKINHNWMKRLSNISNARFLFLMAFVLGLLISVGEFLCTGQIYLATIIYIMKRSPELDLQTMGAFIVYILGMMIPLILLTIAVWKGREVYNISELARKNMPLIKLLNAVVFLAFGVILLLYL